MDTRKRMTWAAGARRASAPPAIPGYLEKGEHSHPADQEDPSADKYKNGDPSSWAEDPMPGPYTQSAAPAIPTEAGDHPAGKRAAERKHRKALERKANKCLRIAEVLLGKKASAAKLERQAYDLMAMEEYKVNSTLRRMGGGFLADGFDDDYDMDGDLPGAPLDFDGDFDDPMIDEGFDDALMAQDPAPWASVRAEMDTLRAEVASLKAAAAPVVASEEDADEALLASMLAEEVAKTAGEEPEEKEEKEEAKPAEEPAKTAGDEPEDEDDVEAAKKAAQAAIAHLRAVEAKLAAKKAGEEPEDEDDEVEAAKKAYLALKAKKAKKTLKAAEDEEIEDEDKEDKEASASTFSMTSDPMGLSDVIAGDNDPLLDSLFAEKSAGDDLDEDEGEDKEAALSLFAEEDEEDPEEDTAAKQANARRAALLGQSGRTASRKGVKALGQVSAPVIASSRSGNSEIDSLSNLWGRKPDVSDSF